MKYEKVIYEKSDKQEKVLWTTPDSISGLWYIYDDKHRETYGVGNGGVYLLIIDKNEANGTIVVFDIETGKIVSQIPFTIKRIDVGTYEMICKNIKRLFKVCYTAYDGNMYFFYNDSTPYNVTNREYGHRDGNFQSRDYSDKAVQKEIGLCVDNYKISAPEE